MILQGTPEWYAERVGKVTASRIADLTAKTKTGYGASRANYLAELIAERLTGAKAESYINAAMQHGIDTEPQARGAYEFYADVEVVQVGFIAHPTIAMAGASPDGLVGDAGLVEIKCPNTSTHIETLLGGLVPDKYIKQIQWQLACTSRQWCDFASYDPRMPESMRLFIHRVERDNELIAQLEKEVREFLAELSSKVAALKSQYDFVSAAA